MKRGFENTDALPQKKDDPSVIIAEARSRLMGVGAVDSEMYELGEIERKFNMRELTAQKVKKQVESLLNRRQDYH